MIKSMTGFGRGVYEAEGKTYTVDIKTINHKYNDIQIKMPRYLISLEDRIRKFITQNISRGKIDVFINVVNTSREGRGISVDRGLASCYIEEMRKLVSEYGIQDDISATAVMRMPDIITVDSEIDEDEIYTEIQNALTGAIQNLAEARRVEGERLSADIQKRLTTVSEYVNQVEKRSANLLEEYRAKLMNRVNELKINDIIDETRLGMEVVFFADKSSICEEVTRLRSHLDSFRKMLSAEGPIGKKLDFLLQEMNRETNTIGSKANCLDITNSVVEMKNEIENIREQIQNIE